MIDQVNVWFQKSKQIAGRAWSWIRPHAKALVIAYGIFCAGIALVALVSAYLNHNRFEPGDPNDARLLFGASCVLGLSLVNMVINTKRWTILATSVFLLIFFGAGLYGLTSQWAIFGWYQPNDNALNILRATLLVGTIGMGITMVWLIWNGLKRWYERWRDRWERKQGNMTDRPRK